MTVTIIDPVVQPLIALGGFIGVLLIISYTYVWFNKKPNSRNDEQSRHPVD